MTLIKNKEVERGTLKRPYFKCSCGKISYLHENMVQPDQDLILTVQNPRNSNMKNFMRIKCSHCNKEIEIGLIRAATIGDN